MKPQKKSANELCTALEIALGNPVDEVPAGFRTIREWATIWGKSVGAAEGLCERHEQMGRMIVKKFRVKNQRCVLVVNHYKAVK